MRKRPVVLARDGAQRGGDGLPLRLGQAPLREAEEALGDPRGASSRGVGKEERGGLDETGLRLPEPPLRPEERRELREEAAAPLRGPKTLPGYGRRWDRLTLTTPRAATTEPELPPRRIAGP